MLNEKTRSDINLNEYKLILCWWEQWRYRVINQECRNNRIRNINDKDFCVNFINEIISIMNKIVSISLIPNLKLRRHVEKKVEEAKECIQGFVQ